MGRVPSNFGERQTKRNWSPPTFAIDCRFFAQPNKFPAKLPGVFDGEGKEEQRRERVKQGWSNSLRLERDGGKGRGSVSTPFEVPYNFSATVAPMGRQATTESN